MLKHEVLDSSDIISKIINSLMNQMRLNRIDIYDKHKSALNLYPSIFKKYIDELSQSTCDFVYIFCDDNEEFNKVINWIKERSNLNCVLYLRSINLDENANDILGNGASLKYYEDEYGRVYLLGNILKGPQKNIKVPSDFKVLSITHVYNEIDVIDKLCEYLLNQDIDIYFLDNWSTDGTYERLCELKRTYPNIVTVERFPSTGRTDSYEWYKQLERTEEISKELNYQWYLHYDADEMRIAPWEHITLKQAIYHVDRCGYNQIGMYTIAYKLTDCREDNIFMSDTYFEFGTKNTYYAIKMWKKSPYIDLKETGGHLAEVKEPRCFPLFFLNRHYPFRTVEQAQKKVFRDRKPRFQKERKEKGWHGHYDKMNTYEDFISNKDELFLWNDNSIYDFYIPFFCNCGIKVSDSVNRYTNKVSGFDKEKSNIIIFGAGVCGKCSFLKYAYKNKVVAWVDNNYKNMDYIFGMQIQSPMKITDYQFEYVLIAIKDGNYINEVVDELLKLGVEKGKIVLLRWENGG